MGCNVRPRPALTAFALSGLLAFAGCVTERTPSRGVTVRPGQPTGQPNNPATRSMANTGQPVTLPPGPVAQPITGRSFSADVKFILKPLGLVPYDGQTLPIISPDGRFLATQRGNAPSWATLLAQPGASTTAAMTIEVFALSDKGFVLSNTPALPDGCILGRSADARGYLVECARADGSRWIGRVEWLSGKVEWLVQGLSVNAHASLSRTGILAFTRRRPDAAQTELVVRTPDGRENLLSDERAAFDFPTFGYETDVLYTIILTDKSTDLAAFRLVGLDRPSGGGFGSVLARQQLLAWPDLGQAYAVFASSQPPAWGVRDATGKLVGDLPASILFFHPGPGKMMEFSPRENALLPLSPNSVAAVRTPAITTPGAFVTTTKNLVFWPEASRSNARAPEARVLDAPHVARATTDPARPIILMGPAAGSSESTIILWEFGFPPQEPPAAEGPKPSAPAE